MNKEREDFLKEQARQGKSLREAVTAYKALFGLSVMRAGNEAVRVYVAQAVAGVEGALKVVCSSPVCHDHCVRRGITLPFVEGVANASNSGELMDPGYRKVGE